MKKILILVLAIACMLGCAAYAEDGLSAQEAIDRLLSENAGYSAAEAASSDISADKRADTAQNGQYPYAVIITCSDSRVPAEHIFDAGIGDLFVIRTAGNVIGDYQLGSVEYGAEHLHASLVVVMGHTQCGAVDAAINGGAHGYIKTITDEISACLPDGCDARQAEILNVENSIARIRSSTIMQELEEAGEVAIKGAIYDIETGKVEFLG